MHFCVVGIYFNNIAQAPFAWHFSIHCLPQGVGLDFTLSASAWLYKKVSEMQVYALPYVLNTNMSKKYV
jgi:hypothetical protein